MITLPATIKPVAIFVIVAALVSGCNRDLSPSQSWENAVKGLYGGTLSNTGELSIVGSITHGGSLWEVGSNKRLFSWNHSQNEYTSIVAGAFSPDERYALTADYQTLVLWDTQSGQALTFWTAPSEIQSIALTPGANYALLGLADHTAALFDVKNGGVKRLFIHENRVRSVSLNRSGELALTGSEDRTAKLWDVSSGELLNQWSHNDEVRLVALSPKGDRAISVSKYDRAAVWDTETGELIGELPLRKSALQRGLTFTSAAFSEDSDFLLTGNSDRLIQLWDANTLEELKRWVAPKRDPWKPTGAAILAVSFTNEPNRYLAIASNGFTHELKR